MLYYFIFEMVNLQIFLQSESKQQLELSKKKTKRMALIIYIVYTILVVATAYIVQVMTIASLRDVYLAHVTLIDTIVITRSVVRLFIDFFMFYLFYTSF